jgi:hypothetical protein
LRRRWKHYGHEGDHHGCAAIPGNQFGKVGHQKRKFDVGNGQFD